MTDQTVSCTSLIGEDSLSNSSQVRHSSCPNLIFPQNRNCPKETLSMSGVGCKGKPQAMGRAQELKRRAIKAASNENVSVDIYNLHSGLRPSLVFTAYAFK